MFGRQCKLLLAAWGESCRHTLHWTPFFGVLWLLAEGVRRITCSFIALALGIHVFCLHAEAEGAILLTMKKVWGMCSEFNISCGRGQCILAALPLLEVHTTKCGQVRMGSIPERLSAQRRKDWHGLHESSYCHFKVYAGTRNLNTIKMVNFMTITPHLWVFSLPTRLLVDRKHIVKVPIQKLTKWPSFFSSSLFV